MQRRHFAEAERYFLEAVSIFETRGLVDDPNLATVLNNLGELYSTRKQYALAEPLYRRAIEINERVFGERHPRVGITLFNYAALLRGAGRKREAVHLEQRAFAIRAGRAEQSRQVVDYQSLRAAARK